MTFSLLFINILMFCKFQLLEVNEVIEVIASLEVNDVTSFLFEVNEVNGVIASLEVSDDTNADVFFFLSLFLFIVPKYRR